MRPGTPAGEADRGQQPVWELAQGSPHSFSPGADGDKLGGVRGGLLRGAFPELNSGSPASWSDRPSPGPCSVLQPGA